MRAQVRNVSFYRGFNLNPEIGELLDPSTFVIDKKRAKCEIIRYIIR